MRYGLEGVEAVRPGRSRILRGDWSSEMEVLMLMGAFFIEQNCKEYFMVLEKTENCKNIFIVFLIFENCKNIIMV